MNQFFEQFENMSTEDSRCIDVTLLYKDIEHFSQTGEIRFTPRWLSDYELDFIVNDLMNHTNVKLSKNFIEKYLSLRSESNVDISNTSDTENTTQNYSDSYPAYVTVGLPEEEFTDEERDDDSDITD